MTEPRRKRRWWIAFVVLLLFFIGGHEYDKRRFETGDRGFSHVTGLQLPANVTATAHARERNDALLFDAHYWVLQGPEVSLLELAPKPEFMLAKALDADEVYRAANNSIAIDADAALIAGYKGNRGGRERWLLLIGKRRALFAW